MPHNKTGSESKEGVQIQQAADRFWIVPLNKLLQDINFLFYL